MIYHTFAKFVIFNSNIYETTNSAHCIIEPMQGEMW